MADTTGEINWGSIAAPTEVAQLAPAKSPDDIPETIRRWVDEAYKAGTVKEVHLPSELAVKLFQREVRDYTFMHTPRLTPRIKVSGKTTVRYKVTEYKAPEAATATAAKK